jgi:hypothetical protein
MILRMKEKKQAQQSSGTAGWKKILVVAVGVTFVVLMILSGMGTSWITGMKTAQQGDTALIDYTIRDNDGNVVLTSNPTIFNTTMKNGGWVFYTSPMSIGVNNTALIVTKVPAQNQFGLVQFGLFKPEMEAVSSALLGMKRGEAKTVTLETGSYLLGNMTFQDFDKIYGNSTSLKVNIGDSFPLTYVEQPIIKLENTTNPELYFVRVATVVDKTNDEIIYNYGYARAEITLDKLSNQ